MSSNDHKKHPDNEKQPAKPRARAVRRSRPGRRQPRNTAPRSTPVSMSDPNLWEKVTARAGHPGWGVDDLLEQGSNRPGAQVSPLNGYFRSFGVSIVREGPAPAGRPQILSRKDIVDIVGPAMRRYDREHFLIAMLDTFNQLIAINTICVGALNIMVVQAVEVFRAAIVLGAAKVIAVHNHPSGNVTPSPEDERLGERLKNVGDLLGIPLLDNIVVGDGYHGSCASPLSLDGVQSTMRPAVPLKEESYTPSEAWRWDLKARCRFVRRTGSAFVFEIDESGPVEIELFPGRIMELLEPGVEVRFDPVKDCELRPNDIFASFGVYEGMPGDVEDAPDPAAAEHIMLQQALGMNEASGGLLYYERVCDSVTVDEYRPGHLCFKMTAN